MKIAKTLKRLRNEKGITQEQLAEMLFISRQSVSSWENDRTQPDIEMLEKLSEIFEVSIEELIYGKKRNVTLETEKPSYNGTLLIVFSILGALLAGTGIVLIFVHFWQKMPMLFKAVLSFLPLLAGQGAGLYVLKNKREKLPWCEGAGVLWTAGIAATLTLIYNIFDLSIYWYTVLIFITVSIIPVILLLGCVSPVIVYYACTITWWLLLLTEKDYYFATIPASLLIIAGCIFTSRFVKKENKSIRSLYSHWISVAAITAFTVFSGIGLANSELILFTGTGALGLCLIFLSFKESDILMPYRLPGMLHTSFMLLAISATPYGANKPTTENILFSALPLVLVVLVFIFSKENFRNGFLTAYCAVCFSALVLFSSVPYSFYDRFIGSNDEVFVNILRVIAISANILLMISGGKEKKLLPINIGFISVAALMIIFLAGSGLSLIGNGLLLLVFGAVLLMINFSISKQNRKKSATAKIEEVSDDEQKN